MVIMVASSPQYFAYKKNHQQSGCLFCVTDFYACMTMVLSRSTPRTAGGNRLAALGTPRRRACAQAAGHLPWVWARQCGHSQPSAVPATACCTAIDSPTFCAPIPTSLLTGLRVVPRNPCLRQHMPCSIFVRFPTHSALNQSVIRTCMPKGSPRRRRQHDRHMCFYR